MLLSDSTKKLLMSLNSQNTFCFTFALLVKVKERNHPSHYHTHSSIATIGQLHM